MKGVWGIKASHQHAQTYTSSEIYQSVTLLRCLAVTLVILFHLEDFGVQFHPGYLGVDIFFVISGYLLIPKAINSTLTGDSWSFIKKRLLRIIPPLIFCLILFSVLGMILLPLDQFENLLRDSPFAATGVINIVLIGRTENYFLTAGNPLLHIWSLSVELQFYVFIPLVIIAGSYLRKRVWQSLLILAVISFTSWILFQIMGSSIAEKIAFYSFSSRLWEFLAGGMVWKFKNVCRVSTENKTNSDESLDILTKTLRILSIIILASTFFLEFKVSSSLSQVLIVVATMLFLADFQNKTITKIPRIFDWIAVRSYSIYLFHFPLVYCIKFLELPKFQSITIYFLVLLLISNFSYIHLERNMASRTDARAFFWINTKESDNKLVKARILSVVLIFIILIGKFNYDKDKSSYPSFSIENTKSCIFFGTNAENCYFGKSSIEKWINQIPHVVIIGDSFGAALLPAFEKIAKEEALTLGVAFSTGCYLNKFERYDYDRKCNERLSNALSLHRKEGNRVLVLAYFWNDKELVRRVLDRVISIENKFDKIVLIGNVPIYPDGGTYLKQDSILWKRVYPATFPKYSMQRDFFEIERFAQVLAEKTGYVWVDMSTLFCEKDACNRFEDGWLYFDESHLSTYGASQAIETLFKKLDF